LEAARFLDSGPPLLFAAKPHDVHSEHLNPRLVDERGVRTGPPPPCGQVVPEALAL